jgi:cyclopropane-fatty-acyl-phospholipid synthase
MLGRGKVEELLGEAGIEINGPNPWDIQVHDDRLFGRVIREKNLGLGEAYMEGWWDCERLDEFFFHLLYSRLDERVGGCFQESLLKLVSTCFNRQSRSRAYQIAERHYNLDNDLFMSFLDGYNQYSCGFFQNTEDLETAQRNKMDLICRKLNLNKDCRVLDIGCGWGGFAKYAAESYGCHVTGVNISREQIEYARKDCAGLPVDIVEMDYRKIEGEFDRIVSIGMFEHVGPKNYREFMSKVVDSLRPEGIFLLHTIGGNESGCNADPWISRYIFPNGVLPSITQIGRATENILVMEDMHNLGPNYDNTLMAWNRRFQNAWPQLKHKYSETFRRMWEYYLLSCAGAFRARSIQVWQMVFTCGNKKQPERICSVN